MFEESLMTNQSLDYCSIWFYPFFMLPQCYINWNKLSPSTRNAVIFHPTSKATDDYCIVRNSSVPSSPHLSACSLASLSQEQVTGFGTEVLELFPASDGVSSYDPETPKILQLRWVSLASPTLSLSSCIRADCPSSFTQNATPSTTQKLYVCRKLSNLPSKRHMGCFQSSSYVPAASESTHPHLEALSEETITVLRERRDKKNSETPFWEILQSLFDPYDRPSPRSEGDTHTSSYPQEDTEDTFLGPLSDIFSVERPRSALSGLWSGAKNVGIGVAGGVVSSIATPVASGRAHGARGVATGLVKGLAAGTVMSLAGCVAGATQVVRGVVNTPEAIHQFASNEKVWDHDRCEWCEYDVVKENTYWATSGRKMSEILEVAKRRSQVDTPSPEDLQKTTSEYCDLTLYETLGVSPDASGSKIKAAYMQLALLHHPDRNPQTVETSKVIFQKISEAYQVLSNDVLREKYNQGGLKAVQTSPRFRKAKCECYRSCLHSTWGGIPQVLYRTDASRIAFYGRRSSTTG